MICQNCRCEIGSMLKCPYCGTEYQPAPAYSEPFLSGHENGSRCERGSGRENVWGLMCVILLAGIFVLRLLQFIFLLIQ